MEQDDASASTCPVDERMSCGAPPSSKGVGPPSRGGGSVWSDHRPSWTDSHYADYLYDDSVAFTSVHEDDDDDGETCLKSMATMDTRRSLATMDTRTFRRVRALRRQARAGGSKGSSRDDTSKRTGGDVSRSSSQSTSGSHPSGRRSSRHSSHRSRRSSCSSHSAGSDSSHSSLHSISLGTASTASDRSGSSSSNRSSDRAGGAPRRVLPLAATLLLSLGMVVTRTGMDLVWLMTKRGRTGSLGGAKRRLDAGDWSSVEYEDFFPPREQPLVPPNVEEHRQMAYSMAGDGLPGDGNRQILLPESDDEFNKLRAQIRGALQDPASSERYFGQAQEKLREQQHEPVRQSEQQEYKPWQQPQQPMYVQEQVPEKVTVRQQAHQKSLRPKDFSLVGRSTVRPIDENGNTIGGKTAGADEEDGTEQELNRWSHLRADVVGSMDLLSEDPFGNDSRNLRRMAPANLFTDEEKVELAKLERDGGARGDSIFKYI